MMNGLVLVCEISNDLHKSRHLLGSSPQLLNHKKDPSPFSPAGRCLKNSPMLMWTSEANITHIELIISTVTHNFVFFFYP